MRMRVNMIEPRCLIKEHGRPCLLRDDFAVGENGFIGPARGPAAPIDKEAQSAAAGLTCQTAAALKRQGRGPVGSAPSSAPLQWISVSAPSASSLRFGAFLASKPAYLILSCITPPLEFPGLWRLRRHCMGVESKLHRSADGTTDCCKTETQKVAPCPAE